MEKCTFDKGDKCVALTEHDCEGCPFRKTKEELLVGRRKARAMLEKLPKEKRDTIEDKYYRRNYVKHEI